MSWRDNISEQGKFRGVPFYYERVDGELGRRTTLKEFFGRDKPLVEDLGRATRKISIDMFVIGDDYDVARDDLREAFEKAGPGELEHPYWGTMTVTVSGSVRVSESTKERGIAKFSATFIEAGDHLREVFAADTSVAAVSNASKALAAAQAAFAKAFSVLHAIESVANDAINAIANIGAALEDVRNRIAAVLQVIDDAKAAIENIVDTVEDLVLTPVALAEALGDLVQTVVNGVADIGEAFEEVADFFGGEDALPAEGNLLANRARVDVLTDVIKSLASLPEEIPAAGDGEAQQQEIKRDNAEAMTVLVQAAVIAAVSTTAVELTYESRDQAEQMRSDISDLIDTLLEDEALGDSIYGPLVDLRASLASHFDAVANTLPELTEYTPQGTIPALVLAYQIYGDANREAEILARNASIRDPSAVPGGQVLKVLVDE